MPDSDDIQPPSWVERLLKCAAGKRSGSTATTTERASKRGKVPHDHFLNKPDTPEPSLLPTTLTPTRPSQSFTLRRHPLAHTSAPASSHTLRISPSLYFLFDESPLLDSLYLILFLFLIQGPGAPMPESEPTAGSAPAPGLHSDTMVPGTP
ncbi:hypothetical protein K435DRAFT_969997 [Dendrothele bispora CBS 962.96]|uniref:Uncharacterized protein n=1 Tax=Dendrothele bispora (strain CBS 962.96) TaxID=1314807 RepID=A0A4S8LEV8_DENBC|nr:hypothetical protein K435DRAFT_969997 [Dendrothele bispora CBS 962.96]